MTKKQDYVRIQLFPYSENVNGPGRSTSSGSSNDRFYFKPVEINVKVGGLIKLGRRVERPRPKIVPQGTCLVASENRNGVTMSVENTEVSQALTPTNAPMGNIRNFSGVQRGSTPENVDSAHFSHKNTNAAISREEAEYYTNDSIMVGIKNQIKMGCEPKGPLGAIAARHFDLGINYTDPRGTDNHDKSTGSLTPKESFKIPILFIAFRSKVVSRSHAELWVGLNSRIYFRDNGSSSGTFLNQMRLSPSGDRSMPHVLNSGDIIQLGVDYQNNQREIFKCVVMKIIVSTNTIIRSKRNNERLSVAIKQLTAAMNPTIPKSSPDVNDVTSDCCICLGGIVLMQALFLASCSHIFHYRCVVPLLKGGVMFLCPLCRQATNLDSRCSDISSVIESEDEEVSENEAKDQNNNHPFKIDARQLHSEDEKFLHLETIGGGSLHSNSSPSKNKKTVPDFSTPTTSKHRPDLVSTDEGYNKNNTKPALQHSQKQLSTRNENAHISSEKDTESLSSDSYKHQDKSKVGTQDVSLYGPMSKHHSYPISSPACPSPLKLSSRYAQHDPRLLMMPSMSYLPYIPLLPQHPYANPYFLSHPPAAHPNYYSYLDYNVAVDESYCVNQSPSAAPPTDSNTHSGNAGAPQSQKERSNPTTSKLHVSSDQKKKSDERVKSKSHYSKSGKKIVSSSKSQYINDIDAGATLRSRDVQIHAGSVPYYGPNMYGNILARNNYMYNTLTLEEHGYPRIPYNYPLAQYYHPKGFQEANTSTHEQLNNVIPYPHIIHPHRSLHTHVPLSALNVHQRDSYNPYATIPQHQLDPAGVSYPHVINHEPHSAAEPASVGRLLDVTTDGEYRKLQYYTRFGKGRYRYSPLSTKDKPVVTITDSNSRVITTDPPGKINPGVVESRSYDILNESSSSFKRPVTDSEFPSPSKRFFPGNEVSQVDLRSDSNDSRILSSASSNNRKSNLNSASITDTCSSNHSSLNSSESGDVSH